MPLQSNTASDLNTKTRVSNSEYVPVKTAKLVMVIPYLISVDSSRPSTIKDRSPSQLTGKLIHMGIGNNRRARTVRYS